jgi:uncharacterized protein (DUF736 family)
MGNGPKERRLKMSLQFVKISSKEYITLDEQYAVTNIVGAGWIARKKNTGDAYYSLQIVEQSFGSALEAMSALRTKVGA